MRRTIAKPRKAAKTTAVPEDQLPLKTQCGHPGCGEVFANPTLAAHHVQGHERVRTT